MCFRKEPLFLQEETQRGKERLFCCSLGTASQEKKVRSKQEEEDNGSFQEDHVVSLFSSFKKWFNPTKKDARRMVFFLRCCSSCFSKNPKNRCFLLFVLLLEEPQEPLFSVILLVLKHTVFFHSKNPKKRKNQNRSSCPRKNRCFL